MGELRLSLLGSPQIFVDGEEKILRERKAIALLTFLTVEGTAQSRDTLATLFWPEHDQQRARANLRYLLWSLRKSVGEAWLRTEGDQIVLTDEGQLRVDVEAFRRHLAEWRAHSHPADAYCAACVEALEAATELYRGDFLQGFSLDDSPQFDDWQFFQAEELRRELAAGLEALVEQQIIGQMYNDAIGHARRWLALNPLHEPASRALMKLYAWSGQYEAAIRQYHRCALALQEEIGVEPDAETKELYAEIRNRRFALPAQQTHETSQPIVPESKTASNLPPLSAPFVGRQTELTQIAARLDDPSTPLLTIVGPGGMGKSTLAVQAGRAAAVHFPDGVWFVPLAGMESPEQMPSAILAGLAVPSGGATPPRQQLLSHLRRQQSLLILDNFEDVLPAAEFVAELLAACSQVKVLVTSRERLNLRAERLLPLGHLAYPTDAKVDSAEGSKYSALRLFEISAQRTQPDFALDATNLPSVVRICQLVDGMPLALEMAAAWTRALPVAEIPAEIEKSLAFLSTGARDVAERHRSIHAVFDHSWQLLTRRERSVLRQLAVFRNGFSREGAEAVADASLLDLSALLDKSWLGLGEDGRYRMHGLAHQYALEKLRNGTEEQEADVLQRHCLFYAALAPSEGIFFSHEVEISAADIENVTLAWETALDQRLWTALGQIAIAVSMMANRWGNLGILAQIDSTINQLESSLLSTPAVNENQRVTIAATATRFLYIAGEYQHRTGNIQRSIANLSRGLALLKGNRNTNHATNVAYTHIARTLGSTFYLSGQFAKAEMASMDALAGFDAADDNPDSAPARMDLAMIRERLGRYREAEELALAMTSVPKIVELWGPSLLVTLGRVYCRQGRYAEAQSALERAVYGPGSILPVSHALIQLGAAMRGMGDALEAEKSLLRGLALADETGDLPAQADLLLELGYTATQTTEAKTAEDYFSRSLVIARDIGRLRTVPLALMGLGQVELMRGRLEKARDFFAQALTASQEVQAPPDVLDILVSVGELYAVEGKPDAAIGLLELTLQHPATTAETRTRALGLLESLGAESSVPTSQLSMDIANQRLEEVARGTLAELQS